MYNAFCVMTNTINHYYMKLVVFMYPNLNTFQMY